MFKNWLVWAVVCAAAVLLTACGGSGSSEESSSSHEGMSQEETTSAAEGSATESTEAAAPAADGPAIVIESFSFGEPLTVAPGATIQITNNDSAEHSVTSDTEGIFDIEVEGGETATLTAPTEPGEYTYFCRYHPDMKGTLIVQ